jgi:hypothetical protein
VSSAKSRGESAAVLDAMAGARAISRVGRRSLGGQRADLGNQYFRSMWESNWARYLNWLIHHRAIQSWRYEARTFEFHTIRRGVRFYTPDFEVLENDGQVVYDEIKGYMDPKSRVQLKRMGLYYPQVRIRVIGKVEYSSIARQMKRVIPGWETAVPLKSISSSY